MANTISPKFPWDCGNSMKVFPIDYTLGELTQVLSALLGANQAETAAGGAATAKHSKPIFNEKKIRTFLQAEYFPSTLLYQLLTKDLSTLPDNRKTPPIPLEILYIIKCLFELSEEDAYRREFQNASFSAHLPIPPYIIKEYLTRLCRQLCSGPADTDRKNAAPGVVFSRHIAFQNDTFKRVILEDLWVREITPRFNKLKELTRQVPLEYQIESLKDCLLTLDRNILNLSAAPRVSDGDFSLDRNVIEQLMRQALSERKWTSNKAGRIRYMVDNYPVSGSTMEDIFTGLQAPPGKAKVSAELLTQARDAYLSHLNQNVEAKTDEESLKSRKFENDYLDICDYLGLSELDVSGESLHTYILEKSKENISCAFQLFTDTAAEYSPSILQPIKESNTKGYVGMLIEQQILYCTQKYLQVYELAIMFAQSLNIGISVNFGSITELSIKNQDRLIGTTRTKESEDYAEAVKFWKYFHQLWKTLYPDDQSIFEEGSYKILQIKAVSTKLWREGKKASHSFPQYPFLFSTRYEVEDALICYNLFVTHPYNSYPLRVRLLALYKLIVTILTLALDKSARKIACFTEKFIKQLPSFLKEIHQSLDETGKS